MGLFNTPSASGQPASPSLVPLTEEDVRRALPVNLKGSVTPHLVQTLNSISQDPMIAENIRENFMGYTGVLKDGKFKTEDYLHAVAYVSFKLMGYSNHDAYMRTFPQRYSALVAKNTSSKDIASYVTAYNKGKLVNLILEQSLVPTWVLNQDLYQKAINVQADLMMNSQSDKVKVEAANSLLTHLKKPENQKFQLSLDTAESSGMREMKNMLEEVARQQREAIASGAMKTVDVAATPLIDRDGAEDVELNSK